jgi:ribosome-associated protein
MSTPDTLTLLLTAAQACEDKKAEDIRILHLDPSESGLTDYFLICHGHNARQNEAISDEIEFQLKRRFGLYANSVEGRRQGEWILLDYVDFIVHVFSADKRAFYALERLRKSATTISLAELKSEVAAGKSAVKKPAPKKSIAKPIKKSPAKPAPKKAVKKSAAKKSAAKKSAKKKPTKKKSTKK